MKLALERLVSTVVILAVGLLLILGIFAYQSVDATNRAIGWEMHTQEVLQNLNSSLLNLVDAETGVRGYIITGNASFLEPYQKAEREGTQNIAQLRQLVKDNSDQIERVNNIENLFNEKLQISKQQVEIRRTQGEKATLDFVSNEQGKVVMDKARAAVEEMKSVETSLLRERENELKNNFSRASLFVFIGIIAGIVLLTLANILIYRENRKRTLAETELKNVNRDLERRVEERTKEIVKTNEALSRSEVFNRATLDSLSAHIAVIDRAGKIIAVNNAWRRFGNENKKESGNFTDNVGTNYLDVCRRSGKNEPSTQIISEKLKLILDGELNEYSVEYPCHSETENRWFLLNITALKTDEGGAVISHTNITDRVLAEENLRHSEEFNRSIFESSPDCVKILDLEGNLLSMNKNGMCVMEIDDFAPFAGKDWKDFWKEEDKPIVYETVSSAREGKAGNFTAFCNTAKGTPRWWEVSVAPVYDGEGKVVRLISVSRDISERREAETVREKL
nr:CHASE3 domain-containing protein [Pyrinomonadaceae bacterium]